MDDTNKQSQKLQSNEEVIEELTRDLESSCLNSDKNTAQNITSNLDTNNTNVIADSWDITGKEHDGSNSNNAQSTDALEDVDEELLRDREINLTEAEKEVCIVKYFCIIVEHVMMHSLAVFIGIKR